MEEISILSYAYGWLIFNGLMALGGAAGLELFIYSIDEESWRLSKRKGDIMFAFFFAPFLATFGMPYLWYWLDGSEILGFAITNSWYNPLTNILLGLTIDIAIKGLRAYANKKTKELS